MDSGRATAQRQRRPRVGRLRRGGSGPGILPAGRVAETQPEDDASYPADSPAHVSPSLGDELPPFPRAFALILTSEEAERQHITLHMAFVLHDGYSRNLLCCRESRAG